MLEFESAMSAYYLAGGVPEAPPVWPAVGASIGPLAGLLAGLAVAWLAKPNGIGAEADSHDGFAKAPPCSTHRSS